jgi:hypothetical protein
MAFADPQSVKIGASTISLPRVSTGTATSTYQSADSAVQLIPSHSVGAKRIRRTARVNHSKIAPDPFTGVNTSFSMSGYIVVDVPKNGYTVAEQEAVVKGLIDFLSVAGNVTKLLGGEN